MHRLLFFLSCLALTACGKPTPEPEPESESLEPSVTVADTVTIATRELRDSVIPPASLAPAGSRMDYHVTLRTVDTRNEPFNRWVNDVLFEFFSSEQVAGYVMGLRDVIDTAKVVYLRELEANQPIEFESQATRTIDQSIEVELNRKGIITFAINEYTYYGGAHGNYATVYQSFATTEPYLLDYATLFTEGSKEAIGKLLNERVEQDRLYDNDEPIPVTDNVGVLENGILFTYPPYEIGPYAAGQIDVVLPYDVLREGGLLSARGQEVLADF